MCNSMAGENTSSSHAYALHLVTFFTMMTESVVCHSPFLYSICAFRHFPIDLRLSRTGMRALACSMRWKHSIVSASRHWISHLVQLYKSQRQAREHTDILNANANYTPSLFSMHQHQRRVVIDCMLGPSAIARSGSIPLQMG